MNQMMVQYNVLKMPLKQLVRNIPRIGLGSSTGNCKRSMLVRPLNYYVLLFLQSCLRLSFVCVLSYQYDFVLNLYRMDFWLWLIYFLPYLRTKTLACFFIVLLVTLLKCGQQEAVLIKYQLNYFYCFKCKPEEKLFFAKTRESESQAVQYYVLQKAWMIIDLCKSASLWQDCRPYDVSKTKAMPHIGC